MKNHLLLFLISLFFPSFLIIACFNSDNESLLTNNTKEKESNNIGTQYYADTKKSKIFWTGFKLTGEHTGTINLKEGELYLFENKITEGQFIFDMSSINCTDLEGKWKNKLDTHLKDGDFFEVHNYPTSQFSITSIETPRDSLIFSADPNKETYLAKGNLAVKDSTHNIQFYIQLEKTDSTIIITSEKFLIDRTKWGIMYHSKKILDNWKEGYIYDTMEIGIKLHLKK